MNIRGEEGSEEGGRGEREGRGCCVPSAFSDALPVQVRLLLLAALCGEHILYLGPPGTAKSELGRRLSQLTSGSYFERLLTRFSVPEVFACKDGCVVFCVLGKGGRDEGGETWERGEEERRGVKKRGPLVRGMTIFWGVGTVWPSVHESSGRGQVRA